MSEFLKLFNTRGRRVSQALLQKQLPAGATIVNAVPQPALPSTIAIVYTLSPPEDKHAQPIELGKPSKQRVRSPKPPGVAVP